MSRLFQSGFEWQSLTAGVEFSSAIGSGMTINTITKNGGSASMRCSGSLAAGAAQGVAHTITLGSTVYGRWYVNPHAIKEADGVCYMKLQNSGLTATGIDIQLMKESGVIKMHIYYNDYASELSNTAAFSFDNWYYIDFKYDTSGAGSTDSIVVKVNGTQVASSTTLNLTSVTSVGYFEIGRYNQNAGTTADTETDVYYDDISFNDSSGSVNNSYPGAGKIVIAVPTGAGDNAATTGNASMISEIPPSDTATSGSTMIELDSNGVIGDYAMTDSGTAGIGSSDTINAVSVLARIREEAAGTSSYQLRIKSASGGTVLSTTAADAGNTTVRTNPNGTTAFGKPLISETDPTTGVAWTPTGTNSIDNMQVGITSVDADSTPDLWCLALAAMIEYVPSLFSPTPDKWSAQQNQPIIETIGIVPY